MQIIWIQHNLFIIFTVNTPDINVIAKKYLRLLLTLLLVKERSYFISHLIYKEYKGNLIVLSYLYVTGLITLSVVAYEGKPDDAAERSRSNRPASEHSSTPAAEEGGGYYFSLFWNLLFVVYFFSA